jgi:filamentous hemagglutinin
LQADALWLSTPLLSNTGGDIGANSAHVTLTTLDGLGAIHGSQRLDVHFLGDYTHLAGQQLHSDGVLALTVDGALTNQAKLETKGELDIKAAKLTNQKDAVIDASAADGKGIANITTTGDIDNQAGASIAGDTLTLSANNITNTSAQGITGDSIRINAQSLTNGKDLGTVDAATPYGEGFIGASKALDLHIVQRLANLDGDIYSGGSIHIAGLTDGTRLATLDNISGRIQSETDASIAADVINNRRRFVETEKDDLSPGEKYALSSERAYDHALSAEEQADEAALFAKYKANNGLSIDDTKTLVSYLNRTGWIRDEHVSDADLQILNAAYRKIAIEEYGQRDGYLVIGPDGNPGAQLKQTDAYLTGTRVKRASAASQILTGGNLDIDLGKHLTNYASNIAATGDLNIGGKAYDGSADARIDNIAITGQYTFQRDMDFMVQPPVPVKYLSDKGWKDDMAVFAAHRSTEVLTSSGKVLLNSTITGRNVSISGRDIANTAVVAGGGLTTFKVDDLAGPGATHLGTTDSVAGAPVASVQGAQTNGVTTGNGPQQAAAQKVGNAEQAIPGLVAPSNGMYDKHADANSPFLVTTAPRFAKGASTSSDYLLRALGDDPSSIHKRLGDGYYEQNLVLDQLLQLTGRRTLNGGDGLTQYQSLMDGAARQAAQLGLHLGAPLTSTQIASLSSDIVWLVDQVVDGQHVLVPVVYLTQATAQRMRADGALIAGDAVDIKASGSVHNDGRISGTQSANISADTLINRGAIDGGQRLAITTQHDTINQGSLSGNRIGIVAGGDVVNAPAVDGLAAHGGVITAGKAGVQIVAGNDVINQGKITSQGDAVIAAGRDVVQNAASTAFGTRLPAGNITAAGSAALVAGRDVTLDQSKVDAGQTAVINAGRDVQLTAATVHGGTGVGISAGRDIVSDTTTEHTAAEQAVKGKHGSVTTSSETITHGSTISSGGDISLQAGRDISLTAATVKADGAVGVVAGRDIDLKAGENTHTENKTTYVKGGHTETQISDSTTVGTTISGNKGVAIGAGRDLTATAATIDSGNGNVAMLAGRDLTLNTANDTHSVTVDTTSRRGNALTGKTSTSTHDSVTDTTTVGTSISGKNVSLAAGHDLNAQAAQVKADQAIRLSAGHDVNLTAGQNVHTEEHDYSKTTSHLLNTGIRDFGAIEPDRRGTHIAQGSEQTSSVGTLLSGDTVSVAAGHDLNATAAQVAGTHDVVMAAGHDLNLKAGENTYTETDTTNKSRSGRMNGGGLSVMVGKQSSKDVTTVRDISHTGSMVGSTDGSVTLSAGNNVHITGSDVLSQTGTAIVGKNVTIDAAVDSTDLRQTHHQGQGGVHLGLGGMAADVANSVIADGQRGSQVNDPRLKALYAAKTAYDVKALTSLNPKAFEAANKKDNPNGINLQLGIGGSSASSQLTTHDETTHGSTIRSQGNVTIAATGGDLDIIGSKVSGDNVALAAANNIQLLSQAEDHSLKSSNKNASGEVGIQIGSDGVGFYGQASVGGGKAHGNGTTHAETTIDAKDTLSIASGGDTTLQGAQAKGNTVLADIGNNLSIRSEQDSDDYASKQQQASGKVVIGYGSGASGSYNQSNVNSHRLGVNEVSGIGAGDGGFNLHVNGNTDLQGGVIASTADASKNRLDTGSLRFSNLQNQANYSAKQVGISGGSSFGSNVSGAAGAALSLATPQHDKENSTTQAGIANGSITVRNGNTDLTGLDRHPTLDNQALKPVFDEQKLQLHQELGQVAGQVVMHAAGDIAAYMANHATTEDEQKAWLDGGSNKILLHGLVGAATAELGGGNAAQGALGAAAGESISEKMQTYLWQQGINPDSNKGKSLMSLASAAIGTIGGGAGVSTALQGEQFNRQLHPQEINWIKDHAKDYASQQCGCDPTSAQIDVATKQLSQQAARQTDVLWAASLPGDDPTARAYLAGSNSTFVNNLGNAQKMFTTVGNQFMQPLLYLPDAKAQQPFYQRYVQPGAINTNQAMGVLLAQAGINAYANQGETAFNAGANAVTGIGEFLLHPIDGFNAVGQDLGSNGVYALNSSLVNSQLQSVYGQDVSASAGTLAALNSSLAMLGVTGAGKGVVAAIGGAARSAAVESLVAAARAAANGDAAGLSKFTEQLAGRAAFAADGTPLMDFSKLSNAQKGVVGELIGGEKSQLFMPDAQRIGRLPAVGEQGIDDLFKVNRPDVDYVVVEYKFGSSKLGNTADGVQMSDSWLTGDKTRNSRILKSVGNEGLSENIENSLRAGRVERWVVNTDPYGNVSVGLLDKNGKFIPDPEGASKILGGKK